MPDREDKESISVAKITTAVLRGYPQYRLEHFYRRGYKDGGITIGQFIVLADHLYQAEFDKLKIQAAFFGVDIDKEAKKEVKEMKKEDVFMFKDPKEYENYSQEEKKELTEKMMTAHKQWSSGKLVKR